MYSATRLLASLPGFESLDSISRALGLKSEQLADVVDFLLQTGLLTHTEKGLALGASRTHLAATSAYVGNHHRKWHNLLTANTEKLRKQDLVFTAPITLRRKDFLAIREQLTKLIQDVSATVSQAPSEEFACLHIDWFHVPLVK